MPLPKIQQPLFDLTIPSTNKKVKFRPFTVKEEKILLIAQESKDLSQIILAIKQIINNCIEGINVDKLSTFDVEYILLKIRSVSVGNEIEVSFIDNETEEKIELTIDINEIEIKRFEEHNKLIKVDDNVSLNMTYPKVNDLDFLKEDISEKERQEKLFNVMVSCIDQVVNGEEVFSTSDFSQEEIDEFVNSLSGGVIKEIKTFFETMPKVRIEKLYKVKSGATKTFVVEGMETFFM